MAFDHGFGGFSHLYMRRVSRLPFALSHPHILTSSLPCPVCTDFDPCSLQLPSSYTVLFPHITCTVCAVIAGPSQQLTDCPPIFPFLHEQTANAAQIGDFSLYPGAASATGPHFPEGQPSIYTRGAHAQLTSPIIQVTHIPISKLGSSQPKTHGTSHPPGSPRLHHHHVTLLPPPRGDRAV